jgi:hypothetical protein
VGDGGIQARGVVASVGHLQRLQRVLHHVQARPYPSRRAGAASRRSPFQRAICPVGKPG